MTARLDDAEFFQELLDGNVTAFRQFFRENGPEVVALCQKILRSVQDAEDVAAEVFLEFWKHRGRYDPARGSLRTYILLLARSRAIDLYRRKAKQQSRFGTAEVADAAEEEAVRKNEPPHQEVVRREFQVSARNALDELSLTERTAIELAFYQGMSHAQIASQLDVPLGTTKSHIRRGLLKLKQKLSQWEW